MFDIAILQEWAGLATPQIKSTMSGTRLGMSFLRHRVYFVRCGTSTCPTQHKTYSVIPSLPSMLQCNGPATSSSTSSSSSTLKRLLAVVGLGVTFGVSYHHLHRNGAGPFTLPHAYCHEKPLDPPPPPPPSAKRFNFIAEAVDKAGPSVVYIKASRENMYFGAITATSAGSGFVVENGEYVITNAHVVSSATAVEVQLNSGQVVRGEVTDLDEVADLALIKMDLPAGTTIPALKFGDSKDIRPGEWVVAMGSPLSLTNTITCGIISCTMRAGKDLGMSNSDMEYVQTDAAITIGNSGGPLVNLDGEVVGINTMTAAPGISFAIPSTVAEKFIRSANKKAVGKFAEGRKYMIGVSMLSLSSNMMPDIRHFLSLPKDLTGGILLTRVWTYSPAHQAGLKTGDVIVRINGQQINSTEEMHKLVKNGSGKKLNVEFYRKQQLMTCIVIPEPM